MFENSLVESTDILHNRNHWPAIFSITLQASLVVALLALPVLHPELLSLHAPTPIFLAPPQPTPPPPPVHLRVTTESSSASTAPTTLINALHPLPTLLATTEAAPNSNPTSIMTSSPGSVFTTSTGSPAIRVVPATSTTAAAHRGILHISNGVTAGLLLTALRPTYPPIAIASHTEGTVIVQAIISTTGHITSAHVLSGPLMLQSSALEAVRTARYRPFLLNNQPTEVDTTFTINFRLGDD